jgi:hypothetical protein
MNTDTLSTTFRVGRRYRCSIALPLASIEQGAAVIETRWEPDVPYRLTKAELRDYRRGRDALLAEVARHIGGPVAVAEL